MMCLICREAATVKSFTSVSFVRGEIRITVSRVPARVCPSCGEAYLDEEVAVRLLREAEDLSESGVFDHSSDFAM